MHKHSSQSASKHVHVTVVITEYEFGNFHLKEQYIECTSPKMNLCPIEFDLDVINEDTNYRCCTPLISHNPTDENVIMHQLKPFKQCVC